MSLQILAPLPKTHFPVGPGGGGGGGVEGGHPLGLPRRHNDRPARVGAKEGARGDARSQVAGWASGQGAGKGGSRATIHSTKKGMRPKRRRRSRLRPLGRTPRQPHSGRRPFRADPAPSHNASLQASPRTTRASEMSRQYLPPKAHHKQTKPQ